MDGEELLDQALEELVGLLLYHMVVVDLEIPNTVYLLAHMVVVEVEDFLVSLLVLAHQILLKEMH
jgi:hypothetical protein